MYCFGSFNPWPVMWFLWLALIQNRVTVLEKREQAKLSLHQYSTRKQEKISLNQIMGKNKCFEFDWRIMGFHPRVRNQRTSPYCSFFAAAVAIEGMHFIATKDNEDLSEQQLLDGYNNEISESGVNLLNLVEYCSNFFLTTQANYPSNLIDGMYVKEAFKKNQVRDLKVYVGGWRMIVPSEKETMETAMIRAVNQQPIIARIAASGYLTSYNRSEVYKGAHEDGRMNHVIVIIGYGKTRTNQKYWLVQNSWGETWGERGCFRIARGNNACKIENQAFIPFPERVVVDEEATTSVTV